METCGCYLGKQQIGTLHWFRDEQQLVLQAACPFEQDFIYRLLLDTGKELIPLGVMMPQESRFVLHKRLPLQLAPVAAYIDRTLPGETHLPGLPLALSAFVQEDGGLRRGCWMDTELLLLPLQIGGQCSWIHLLCLASVLEQEGRLYAVLGVKDGLYIPLSDMLRNGTMIW